jgi:hypothetical protein
MQKISTGHSGMHCFFLPLLEHTLCRDTRVHEDIQQLQLYCLRSNAIQKCIIATSNVCCMLTIILRSTHLYPPKVPKAKRHCYAECNNLQSITLRAQYRSVQHNNTLPSPCTYPNPHLNKHCQNCRKSNTHTHTQLCSRTRRIPRRLTCLTRRRPRHHHGCRAISTRTRHARTGRHNHQRRDC